MQKSVRMTLRNPICSHSTLAPAVLETRVLTKYDLRSTKCRLLARGLNDTYEVVTDTRRYLLRVYTYGWRTLSEIKAELQLLKGLERRGIQVSIPIKRLDGRSITRIQAPEGTRYAVLFSDALGKPLRATSCRDAREYGRLVAKMHVNSDTMRLTHGRFHLGRAHLLDEPIQLIQSYRSREDKSVATLTTLGEQLGERMDALLPVSKPYYGICHGDHHGGNAHIDDSGRITLFDFDCFGYGWRSYDIAVFLWARTGFGDWSQKRAASRRRLWKAFCQGYNGVRQLCEAELAAVPLFVAIRHVFLLGLHADLIPKVGQTGVIRNLDHHVCFIQEWARRHHVL